MIRNLLVAAFFLSLLSCVKDEPVVANSGDISISGPRIFILNEGNFGTGNSSLSLYDEKSGDLVEDVYKQVNAENLGDVLQSMALSDRKYYLVVNHSGKIVVCDKQLNKLAQITGMASPRYFLAVDRTKAYVSDYLANKIHILDLRLNLVSGSIACKGWTEQLVMAGDVVVVTNVKSEFVYFIDPKKDQITDSVKVGFNASGLVIDDLGKIWALTSGDQTKNIQASLVKIDPNTKKVIHQRYLGTEPAMSLCTNGRKDRLYYLAKHVYRLAISDSIGVGNPVIQGNNKTIYGLGVHPDSEKIFVSDAIDFSQRSTVYEYDGSGNEIRVFKSGIITNGFYFE